MCKEDLFWDFINFMLEYSPNFILLSDASIYYLHDIRIPVPDLIELVLTDSTDIAVTLFAFKQNVQGRLQADIYMDEGLITIFINDRDGNNIRIKMYNTIKNKNYLESILINNIPTLTIDTLVLDSCIQFINRKSINDFYKVLQLLNKYSDRLSHQSLSVFTLILSYTPKSELSNLCERADKEFDNFKQLWIKTKEILHLTI